MSFDASFGMQISGQVSADDRGPAGDNGTFPDSVSIFSCSSDKINFDVSLECGEFNVNMAVSHAKDDFSERVVHSRISCDIAISDIGNLHAFLGFLLTSMSKDKA